jgi:release factor glutamine methyltransferase
VDADPTACANQRRNAANAGIRVDVREGPMHEVLDDERFAVVIADPPWVSSHQVAGYPADPPAAIDGGRDGLDLVRACLEVIDGHLVDGGHALLQTGPDQPEAVAGLVSAFPRLWVREVRREEGGALVRIDRRWSSED